MAGVQKKETGNVLGVIPARLRSSRLPEKPLLDICGKPMIQWVYERASTAMKIDELVVATDSEKISRVVRGFGGRALLTSDKHRSGTDRLVEVAEKYPSFQILLNIQGDEPLIDPGTLDFLTREFSATDGALMGTLMKRITLKEEALNPNVVKVVTRPDHTALYFSRSPIPFDRDKSERNPCFKHIGIYIYQRDFLLKFPSLGPSRLEEMEKLEQLRVLEAGENIYVFETGVESVGVDTIEDLEHVRRVISGAGTTG